MCDPKTQTKAKLDRLIGSMDRLSDVLERVLEKVGEPTPLPTNTVREYLQLSRR